MLRHGIVIYFYRDDFYEKKKNVTACRMFNENLRYITRHFNFELNLIAFRLKRIINVIFLTYLPNLKNKS